MAKFLVCQPGGVYHSDLAAAELGHRNQVFAARSLNGYVVETREKRGAGEGGGQ